jgi:hypothetical protein
MLALSDDMVYARARKATTNSVTATPVVYRCVPLWSVVERCGALWSVVHRCGALCTVVNRCAPLCTNATLLPSSLLRTPNKHRMRPPAPACSASQSHGRVRHRSFCKAAASGSNNHHREPVSEFIFSLNGQADNSEAHFDKPRPPKRTGLLPNRHASSPAPSRPIGKTRGSFERKQYNPKHERHDAHPPNHSRPKPQARVSIKQLIESYKLTQHQQHDVADPKHAMAPDTAESNSCTSKEPSSPHDSTSKKTKKAKKKAKKPVLASNDQLNEDGMHISWLIRRRTARLQQALIRNANKPSKKSKRPHIFFDQHGNATTQTPTTA